MRKLNLYSPFVPHIVEFPSGKFAVRKWLFGWKYYDNQIGKKDDYWWSQDEHDKWFKVDTLEQAKLVLEVCRLRKTVNSKKPVRIHL